MHSSFITCILQDTSLTYFFVRMHVVFSLITVLQAHPPTVLECPISLTSLYPFLCIFISHLHKRHDLHIVGVSSLLPLHHCFYNLTMLKCIHLVQWCQPLLHHPHRVHLHFVYLFLWQWALRLPSTPFFYTRCCKELLSHVSLRINVRLSLVYIPRRSQGTPILDWKKNWQ